MNTAPLIELTNGTISTPNGRVLFDGLNLLFGKERAALIGRNGVGKSSLLAVLAGQQTLSSGSIRLRGKVVLVPQRLGSIRRRDGSEVSPSDSSQGELRKAALKEAFSSDAQILLLDEPSEDLDEATVEWLSALLGTWNGAVIVASHDPRILQDFQDFFIASESGCRAFSGSVHQLFEQMEQEALDAELRYVSNLNRLVENEERIEKITRRRDRKKRYGRCSELDRATSKIRLNTKRSRAQVYQGKFKQLREESRAQVRQWTKATRRALSVRFSVRLEVPTLPEPCTKDLVTMSNIAYRVGERELFSGLNLSVRRDRIAAIGNNGVGKTTLLELILGQRSPTSGKVAREASRIGSIAQGGADWMLENSLVELLSTRARRTTEQIAELLLAHRFPFALANRPLTTLSPGERVRAAFITLFQQIPTLELLVLDEPTYSLDLVGRSMLTEALQLWPGGLIVASHDHDFLAEIGIDRTIRIPNIPTLPAEPPGAPSPPPRQ